MITTGSLKIFGEPVVFALSLHHHYLKTGKRYEPSIFKSEKRYEESFVFRDACSIYSSDDLLFGGRPVRGD
jgi:hypothetical protein